MSQADAYELHLDLDRDGYFGLDTSDPNGVTSTINILPSPVRYRGLYYKPYTSNSVVSLMDEETDYGVKVLSVDTGGDANGGAAVGYHETLGVAGVKVDVSHAYRVQVWVKYLTGTGNIDLTLSVIDQNLAVLGSATFTPTADYVSHRFSFTTNSDSTALAILITKATTTDQVTFKAAGFYVANTTAAIFNAGSISNHYDNISAYVEQIDYTYGCTQYSEAVSPPAEMNVVLNNIDGVFTPGSGTVGQYLSKGLLVRLRALVGSTYYNLFYGTLDSIRYDVGTNGARRAYLRVVDPVPQLSTALYNPILQQNVTTDAVLQEVFDSQAVVYPNPGWYWILDAPGYSELDQTTVLFETNLTNFEVGDTTFDFAGDITGADASLNALALIREYVYAEQGRFFYDAPTGQFKFFNRTHDVNAAELDIWGGVLDGVFELDDPPAYTYGEDVLTHISLNYYPRVTGTPAATLYPNPTKPITLSTGQTYTFNARYQDPNAPNAQVGGVDMIYPVPGLDYVANSASDGSGSDETAFVGVSVNFLATSASVTLINYSGITVYLTTFRLRGTPLTAYARATAEVNDGPSLGAQGDYRKTIEMSALGDATLANSFANYLVQRYKRPMARLEGFSLWANRDDTSLVNALTIGIGTYLEADDTFLVNIENKYIVTALHHSITPIRTHWVRLFLEPLDRSLYWILDDPVLSILESTTRLYI